MKLAEEQERILQLCSFEGHAEMDHVEPVENGLQVEGILTVDILYATTDDSFRLHIRRNRFRLHRLLMFPA